MPQLPGDQRRPSVDEPTIGVDEWVARAEERLERRRGLLGAADRAAKRIPPVGVLALIVVPAASVPFLTSSDYLIRVGVNTIIFALLCLGLNTVVGYAGLLDLGYVAFYGFGAYSYALVSSAQFGLHWPTAISIPLIVMASAVLGLLLGLPSRRLLGDYLAIVTLFFGQIFVLVVNNANRITPPGGDAPMDFTGGPNGIAGVDPFNFFGFELTSVSGYYFAALAIFALVISGLYLLNESRTGRAWRALREDPLAAQLMGTPINRLKLLAFMFGAAVAGLTGTVFAAVQVGVFPGNFDLALLITIYTMVILGGAGSIVGVVLGAFVINVALEALRTPDQARWVFYGVIALGVVALVRPRLRAAAVIGATVALGLVVFHIAALAGQGWTSGHPQDGLLSDVLQHWVIRTESGTRLGQGAIAVILAGVVALSYLGRRWRPILAPPLLYLAAVAWENILVDNPSVTRLILLGAMLVVMMAMRPQGLLGTARVEIA